MNDSELAARVALRALNLGLTVKPSHIGSLAGHIRLAISHRDSITDGDIDAHLQTMVKTMRSHFGLDHSESAVEKLDRANATLAKRETAAKPDGTLVLSDRERKQLEKMTPAQQLDFANLKNAAAIDAMKKMKAEKK